MRRIEWTTQFKRDYKREKRGQHSSTLDAELSTVIGDLPMIARCSLGAVITR